MNARIMLSFIDKNQLALGTQFDPLERGGMTLADLSTSTGLDVLRTGVRRGSDPRRHLRQDKARSTQPAWASREGGFLEHAGVTARR